MRLKSSHLHDVAYCSVEINKTNVNRNNIVSVEKNCLNLRLSQTVRTCGPSKSILYRFVQFHISLWICRKCYHYCNNFPLERNANSLQFTDNEYRILEIYYHWPFGDFMCRVLSPLQDVLVCVSVVTHATIALERHRAILKAMINKISVTITRAVICVTWVSCYFATALPIAVSSRTKQQNGKIYCVISFPSTTFRQVFEI